MPSTIKYLNVVFRQDKLIGNTVYPTDWETSLPDDLARSLSVGGIVSIVGPGTYEEMVAPLDESMTIVNGGTATLSLKQMVEDEGVGEDDGNNPFGRGREVRLAPGSFAAASMGISQSQSITCAAPGSSALIYQRDPSQVAETGVLVALDDRLSHRGIPSRGVIQNVCVDGGNNDPDIPRDGGGHAIYPVHGYYGAAPAEDGESHSFIESLFVGCTGDGIHVVGRKQLRMLWAKATSVEGFGLNGQDINDSKSFGCGFNGKKGAARIRHWATPKFIAGDAWIPDDFDGQATWDVGDQVRMLVDAYEIEGRIVVIGRNFGNTNRWEMADNIFRAVNFKLVDGLSPSYTYTRDDASVTGTINANVYLEDSDNTIFDGCSARYDGITPTAEELAATHDYFLQLGTRKTGAANIAMYPGNVKFMNMSGIVHSRGRLGDTAPRLAFKKHFCNRPELVEWDLPVGQLVEIRWDDANPPRNWIKAGAYGGADATYNKADYPMAYLWNTNGTLDDVNTTFTVRAAPLPSAAGWAYATPCWP